ncbi:MAG: hypothetical protein RLZ55_883 [Actinomycetota bacterium]|jgi:hypothetical protein
MSISKRTIVPVAVTSAVVAGFGLTAAAVTAQDASAQLTAGTNVPAVGSVGTSSAYQQGLQDAMIKATQAKLDADQAAEQAAAQAAEQARIDTYIAAVQTARADQAAAAATVQAPVQQSASTSARVEAPSQAQSAATTSAPASTGGSGDASAWANSSAAMAVKSCESGNNYSTNTGNGYYGAWQFDISSWLANGGGAYAATPDQASAAAQDQVAYNYYQSAGWGPWSCAK